MLDRVDPLFVEFIPDELTPGKLYISIEYATASHLCCCGCGEKVVTPFTPTDWRITFDGETVSLHPSIGNWEQPCRTHYVIDRNLVFEHGPWTRSRIDRERVRDRSAKAEHYGAPTTPQRDSAGKMVPPREKSLRRSLKLWLRLDQD